MESDTISLIILDEVQIHQWRLQFYNLFEVFVTVPDCLFNIPNHT